MRNTNRIVLILPVLIMLCSARVLHRANTRLYVIRLLVLASIVLLVVPVVLKGENWIQQPSFDQLTLVICLHADNCTVGEQMNVTLKLLNEGRVRTTLVFPTSQVFDFTILDSNGREVFRWSSDRIFLQIITKVTLDPNETFEQTLSWKIPTTFSPGTYTIVGYTSKFTIEGQNGLYALEARRDLSIVEAPRR